MDFSTLHNKYPAYGLRRSLHWRRGPPFFRPLRRLITADGGPLPAPPPFNIRITHEFWSQTFRYKFPGFNWACRNPQSKRKPIECFGRDFRPRLPLFKSARKVPGGGGVIKKSYIPDEKQTPKKDLIGLGWVGVRGGGIISVHADGSDIVEKGARKCEIFRFSRGTDLSSAIAVENFFENSFSNRKS